MTVLPHVLSRQIISPEIILYQHNFNTNKTDSFDYQQFSDMVDYWKFLLVEKYGATTGQTAVIEFNLTNIYYFTAVFAAWELGLILIVDWPHAHNEQNCHSKSYTIHGKIDHAIVYSEQLNPDHKTFYREWDVYRTCLHCRNVITEKDFDNYQIKDHSKFKEITQTIYATPTSQAIWTATSGSTGDPKQQRIDHESVLLQAQRLVTHLNFKSNDSVLHTNNLHHGASACYHFLPGLMKSTKHHIMNSRFRPDSDQANKAMAQYIIDRKINKLFLYTPAKLLSWLRTTDALEHNVEVTTLYYCTKEIVELAKDKNVKLIKSIFGDTTIGYGFLIKTVDPSMSLDDYEPNCLGPKLDDFFDFKIENGFLYIQIPGLNRLDWKTSNDNFEIKNNKYYFLGRGTNYRINDEWINHNEIESKVNELFTVDQEEGATIVVDNEEQQVYLAIWIENSQAESKFNWWLSQRYRSVYITKYIRGLDKEQFMGSRKISRQLLKEYFRTSVPRIISFTDSPWCLS
jgi:acyl-coenzyme A synthetase/AMP-(fatty) acid ligase